MPVVRYRRTDQKVFDFRLVGRGRRRRRGTVYAQRSRPRPQLWAGLLYALLGLLLGAGCSSTPEPKAPHVEEVQTSRSLGLETVNADAAVSEASNREDDFKTLPEADLPSEPAAGETLASRRLLDLQQDAEAFLRSAEALRLSEPEQQRRAATIATGFENYIVDFPKNVHALILYGKFLRAIGQHDRANLIFVSANELDPKVAVVKQQIGNYLAETGEYALAWAYFRAAAQLEPQEAVYHYQIAELLRVYRERFVELDLMTRPELDAKRVAALELAVAARPGDLDLQAQLAQAQENRAQPDLPAALQLWQGIEAGSADELGRQWARVNQARLLMAQQRQAEAAEVLARVDRPELAAARADLESRLAQGSGSL